MHNATERLKARCERGGVAEILSTAGLVLAMLAAALTFTVLHESAFSLRFETGVIPAGFDPSGGQIAMVASLFAALAGSVLIGFGVIGRTTWYTGTVALVAALAAPVYGLLAFVSVLLAFG